MDLAGSGCRQVSGGELCGCGFVHVCTDFAGEMVNTLQDFFWLAVEVEYGDFDVLACFSDVVGHRSNSLLLVVGVDQEGAWQTSAATA